MKTDQERGDWAKHWPEDGDTCPDCRGQVETQEFGVAGQADVVAWCVGINGTRQEDADESDEDGCGCGWEGTFKQNRGSDAAR